jgi:hypothetical protein
MSVVAIAAGASCRRRPLMWATVDVASPTSAWPWPAPWGFPPKSRH